MVKYLGSKRRLLPLIVETVGRLCPPGPGATVLDLFSGTARVGHALKRAGYAVLANDHNAYAHTLARAYVQADRDALQDAAERWVRRLNRLPGAPGYVTRTFCEEARFFRPENGARIDAVRAAVAAGVAGGEVGGDLEAVLLTSLLEAADRVDSTVGVQMAYLKKYAARAANPLTLRVPDVLPRAAGGPGHAYALDALDAAATLRGDVAYLDPPYNQHKYVGNYHVWETLVRDDRPEAYGVARKRIDCRERKSVFNSKPGIAAAMRKLIDTVDARHLVVSFSDEGYLDREELVEMLSVRGVVEVVELPYDRYVGAKLGQHNPSGERVGTVSHLRNVEYLFVCTGA